MILANGIIAGATLMPIVMDAHMMAAQMLMT